MIKIRKGTTYIELLVYIAVLTIFMSGMVMYTLIGQKQRLYSNAIQELSYNIRFINNKLNYEIGSASSVSVDSPNQITLTYDLSEDSYRNPTIIRLNGGVLEIGIGTDTNRPCNTTNFCNLSTNLVSVDSVDFQDLTITGGLPTINYTLNLTYIGNSTINSDNVIKRSISSSVVANSSSN